MRRYRRNADDRQRRLERRAAGGDPEAELAYDRELWRTGKAIPHYAERLLADFVEDLRAFRSYTRLAHDRATLVLEGLEGDPAPQAIPGAPLRTTTRLVASPGGAEGHMAQLAIPDSFGRRRGLMLSLQVVDEEARWGNASQTSLQDVARAEKAGRPIRPSTVIRVCVALIHPQDPFSSPIHPLYFFHRNEGRWLHHAGARPRESLTERRLPRRMFCARALARDFDTPENALRAIERGLASALEDLRIRMGWVDQILDRSRRGAGSLEPNAVMNYVRTLGGDNAGFNAAVQSLQSSFGPVIGAAAPGPVKPWVRAWNLAGDGMLEAAMLCLAEWLVRNERAVIQEVRVDPYNQESGYFVRAYMDVTSRRARRTRNPIRFEVDWDRMNGAWADRGDDWIGNTVPPGGRWKISMVGSPATVQDLVRPAEQWIRAVFPGAEIMVAAWNEPHGRPAYRPSR
jgi:hypothetical protein